MSLTGESPVVAVSEPDRQGWRRLTVDGLEVHRLRNPGSIKRWQERFAASPDPLGMAHSIRARKAAEHALSSWRGTVRKALLREFPTMEWRTARSGSEYAYISSPLGRRCVLRISSHKQHPSRQPVPVNIVGKERPTADVVVAAVRAFLSSESA